MLLVLRATREAAWEHVIDLCCQSRGHVATKFLLFTLIFFNQAALIGLRHVLTALPANLVDRPKNHFFRGAIARATVSGEVANVSASDISRTIDGESDAVRNFALPPLCIETRLIPGALASIDVNPSSLMF
jgi:hypothetical protein